MLQTNFGVFCRTAAPRSQRLRSSSFAPALCGLFAPSTKVSPPHPLANPQPMFTDEECVTAGKVTSGRCPPRPRPHHDSAGSTSRQVLRNYVRSLLLHHASAFVIFEDDLPQHTRVYGISGLKIIFLRYNYIYIYVMWTLLTQHKGTPQITAQLNVIHLASRFSIIFVLDPPPVILINS